MICSHHLVKSGAVAGARAITDTARVVHRVTRDAENPRVRILSVDKANGFRDDGPALRYVVDGEGADARVAWLHRDETGNGTQPIGASQAKILMALRAAQQPMTGQQLVPQDRRRLPRRPGLPRASLRARPRGAHRVRQVRSGVRRRVKVSAMAVSSWRE